VPDHRNRLLLPVFPGHLLTGWDPDGETRKLLDLPDWQRESPFYRCLCKIKQLGTANLAALMRKRHCVGRTAYHQARSSPKPPHSQHRGKPVVRAGFVSLSLRNQRQEGSTAFIEKNAEISWPQNCVRLETEPHRLSKEFEAIRCKELSAFPASFGSAEV